MITFCKSVNCPTSQELLAFQNRETTTKKADAIEDHLNLCEFCEAEIEFYANYPQADETIATIEIPIHLQELAEALLGNKRKEISTLNKLLDREENLTVKSL